MILCIKCNTLKLLEDFPKYLLTKKGTGKCRVCYNEQALAYYKANPKPYHDRAKLYTAENKEAIGEYKAGYAKEHSERLVLKSTQWRLNNKEAYRLLSVNLASRYRARKLRACPSWLSDTDYQTIKNYYEAAKIYEKYYNGKYDVDHIIPLQGKHVCGLHVPWNLQVLRASDNRRKSNKI